MTVLEVLQQNTRDLERQGIESPRLNVELLLGYVLRLPRLQLHLEFDRVLAKSELEPLRALIRRRAAREPLQHILGSTSFCGHQIHVTREVLVPRPETELLAEHAWTWIKSNPPPPGQTQRVLDFGTGSGCLAAAIALACPMIEVLALDISPQALEIASRNVALHCLTDRIQLVQSDGFSALPPKPAYDLIVSNPPYIPRDRISDLPPEVRDHDPRLALDGGEDGLDFYRRLTREASAFLLPHGRLMLELGDDQEPAVRQLLSDQLWIVEAVHPDYNRVPRIGIARRSV